MDPLILSFDIHHQVSCIYTFTISTRIVDLYIPASQRCCTSVAVTARLSSGTPDIQPRLAHQGIIRVFETIRKNGLFLYTLHLAVDSLVSVYASTVVYMCTAR